LGRREHATEHPLETLYRARDAAWQAARALHDSGIPHDDRSCYEHVLDALQTALDEIGTTCARPVPSGQDQHRQAGHDGAEVVSLLDRREHGRGRDESS